MYVLVSEGKFVNKGRYYYVELSEKPKNFYDTLEEAQERAKYIRENSTRAADELEAEIPVLEKKSELAKNRIAKYKASLLDKDNLPFKEVKSLEKNLRKAKNEVIHPSAISSYRKDVKRHREYAKVRVAKVMFDVP